MKGTAISTSTSGAAAAAAAIASSSASAARDPFIFQFPATNLRRIALSRSSSVPDSADTERHKLEARRCAP
ncbi:hypothetical protein [Sphingomonas aerolata]|uniref:hypothetical protein n=1 Tax=Sphingomonas aerolata TaxID=185951 RepID=UPI002FE33A73